MTASTTWLADRIYIIQDHLIVSSSAVLTIKQGAVVKFTTNAYLEVSKGKLDVQGTSTDPVYFTSINDDSVGGDMNDDATATTPNTGDWAYIKVDANSTTTMQNAIIRYGGGVGGSLFADVVVNGGYLAATSTTFASSTYYGLHVASGTVKVTSSTFSSCGQWAFFMNWNDTGNVTITSSTFVDNTTTFYGVGSLDFTSGPTFTLTGNTSTRNWRNAWTLNGYNGANATLGADTMPYTLGSNNFTVSSTKTLTINPNVIVKFEGPGIFTVDGTLKVLGTTSTNMVYFTSIKDDSVGGDTNNDGANTSSSVGDWYNIQLDGGSSSTFNYAMMRYGGQNNAFHTADIYEGGGKLTVWHSTIASSSNYGIQVASGTLTISSSTLQGDGTTSTLAIYNSTNVTSSATAKQNWWSSSNGPYNVSSHPTGTTDGVGDHITFIPWLTSAP